MGLGKAIYSSAFPCLCSLTGSEENHQTRAPGVSDQNSWWPSRVGAFHRHQQTGCFQKGVWYASSVQHIYILYIYIIYICYIYYIYYILYIYYIYIYYNYILFYTPKISKNHQYSVSLSQIVGPFFALNQHWEAQQIPTESPERDTKPSPPQSPLWRVVLTCLNCAKIWILLLILIDLVST
jgi:hypothetical protein